jgi:hypothetical protein
MPSAGTLSRSSDRGRDHPPLVRGIRLQRSTARWERPRARSPCAGRSRGRAQSSSGISPVAVAIAADAHGQRWREQSRYSKTPLGGKARANNAQCATLVVRALRPIIPKKKIVKPHAVRRSLRARITGSLDPTRHTNGKDNARGGEPFQSSMQPRGARARARCTKRGNCTGRLAIWGRCGRRDAAGETRVALVRAVTEHSSSWRPRESRANGPADPSRAGTPRRFARGTAACRCAD